MVFSRQSLTTLQKPVKRHRIHQLMDTSPTWSTLPPTVLLFTNCSSTAVAPHQSFTKAVNLHQIGLVFTKGSVRCFMFFCSMFSKSIFQRLLQLGFLRKPGNHTRTCRGGLWLLLLASEGSRVLSSSTTRSKKLRSCSRVHLNLFEALGAEPEAMLSWAYSHTMVKSVWTSPTPHRLAQSEWRSKPVIHLSGGVLDSEFLLGSRLTWSPPDL